MQNEIREKCMHLFRIELIVDGNVMAGSHEKFMRLKREGMLLSPDEVGNAVAGLAVCREKELHSYTGKFINWNDELLQGFYKKFHE